MLYMAVRAFTLVIYPIYLKSNSFELVGYTSAWVNGFGLFFYLLNIVLFLNNCVCISVRFHLMRGSFIKSFTDQFECLFIPAFVSIYPSPTIFFINA